MKVGNDVDIQKRHQDSSLIRNYCITSMGDNNWFSEVAANTNDALISLNETKSAVVASLTITLLC